MFVLPRYRNVAIACYNVRRKMSGNMNGTGLL